MKKYRLIQLMTGIHRIHSVRHGYGWKVPFLKLGYFKNGWQWLKPMKNARGEVFPEYHNCSWSGVY